ALQLLAQMDEGLTNMMSYGAAISSCSGQNWQQAVQLLAVMKAKVLRPNYVVFSGAIGACASQSAWPSALSLLEHLRSLELRGVGALGAAINACERASQWQAALSLLFAEGPTRTGVDLQAVNSAITACEKGQQWPTALLLFEEVKADIVTFAAVVSCLGAAAKWVEVTQMLRRLRGSGVQSNDRMPGRTDELLGLWFYGFLRLEKWTS
ncbi:Pentatricopeptide repeat-containing protein MRL1, partial [Durusdinium trenchii]